MEDSNDAKEKSEKEHLMWKTRQLLLRNRVLQAQIITARQAKEATLGITHSTNKSIESTNDEKHHRMQSEQEEMLDEKQSQIDQLEGKLSFAKSQIFQRSKIMICELWDIYPITEFPDRKGYSICDIHLPSIENFEGHDETMVSVAVGYVSHLLLLLSEILDITLRFPLRYSGSKSLIYCNRRNQMFPLYIDSFKSRDWVNFSYGMNLLNFDIMQIRTLYGLPTTEPEETLANLHGLKLMFSTDD